MSTRFSIQRDKRSNITFAPIPSDTTAKATIPANVMTPIVVPEKTHLAFISVTGNEVYFAINVLPTLPTTAAFLFGPGEQINNGGVKGISVNPNDTINIITDNIAKVQISFYENESVE